jgi:thymidylate kinase
MKYELHTQLAYVEGTDLVGKTTTLNGVEEQLSALNREVIRRHLVVNEKSETVSQNNPATNTDVKILRTIIDDHLSVARGYAPYNKTERTIVLLDSLHALRAAAFVSVSAGVPHAVRDLYADLARTVPKSLLVRSVLLTASLEERQRRYQARGVVNSFDQVVLDVPQRAYEIDLAIKRMFGALVSNVNIVDTSNLSEEDVVMRAMDILFLADEEGKVIVSNLIDIQGWHHLYHREIDRYEKHLLRLR